MVKSSLTCYMCDQPATGKEHAPPRCIFPEANDVSDFIDRRINLISVPSCDEHNSKKSKDDEYLLYVLSTSITSNPVGHTQALTKLKRAIGRSPALFYQLNQNAIQVPFTNFNTGDVTEAVALFADGNRINSVLDKCARALYFHITDKKFSGNVKVVNGFLLNNQECSEKKLESFELLENVFGEYPYHGNNQDTFKYKIICVNGSAILLLEFFETSKAIVDLRPYSS